MELISRLAKFQLKELLKCWRKDTIGIRSNYSCLVYTITNYGGLSIQMDPDGNSWIIANRFSFGIIRQWLDDQESILWIFMERFCFFWKVSQHFQFHFCRWSRYSCNDEIKWTLSRTKNRFNSIASEFYNWHTFLV